MFILSAVKNHLSVGKKERLTSGSVNIYQVHFDFSSDWDGLSKVVLFQSGCVEKSILLDSDGECTIPWEVLTEPGRYLMVGICGKRGEELILPTIWANLGTIQEGALPDRPSVPPTPEIWEQQLASKGDALSYDGTNLSLMSGDKLLSTVQVISDHRKLLNLDAEDQHPIAAITGLSAELKRIPEPVEALTNIELEEMLK